MFSSTLKPVKKVGNLRFDANAKAGNLVRFCARCILAADDHLT
jgi:hypothetical protein